MKYISDANLLLRLIELGSVDILIFSSFLSLKAADSINDLVIGAHWIENNKIDEFIARINQRLFC